MKRMTYRLEDQCGNPTDSIILESDLISLNSSEKWKKVLSRLAAIEDILGDEYDLDELNETIQAKREGRCVVQKFAPGSEVWIVERDEDGEAAEVSGFVFVVSVSGIAIVSPSINGCSDLDFILSDFVEETASNFSGDFSGYPISDCYKSHEEAQAALLTNTFDGGKHETD